MNRITVKVDIEDSYLGTRIDEYNEVEDFRVLEDGSVMIIWEGGGTLLPSGSFNRIDYEEEEE